MTSGQVPAAEAEPPATFGSLLKRLRTEAGLTQQELAEAARMSPRSVSDLERGVASTARNANAQNLADALRLAGPVREAFEAAARGRVPAGGFAAVGRAEAPIRALPRDIASFTGRDAEWEQLIRVLPDRADDAAVTRICAVDGMAGVGKTAFAVHAAHRLAPSFPDGQFFVRLRGHTPGQKPVEAADALMTLLLAAGITQQQIPGDQDARAAMWTDRMADRRAILLLDDATSSEQVKPLLPASAQALVLITSRRRLSALPDALAITLDTLPADEASRLLVRLADRPRLSPDDKAVIALVELCGRLPLAISITAGQLKHHSSWTAADLVADLATAANRLTRMHGEADSVAAAFAISYEKLSADHQRLFRRLGINPGTDIDSFATAALEASDPEAARSSLDELFGYHLIEEPARGRFRLHDLLRQHARALAAEEPPAERAACLDRLLNYYLHAARKADHHLARRISATAILPAIGSGTAHTPDLSTRQSAVDWMKSETLNLHAATNCAVQEDRYEYAIAIPDAMHGFLRTNGDWNQALILHQTAMESARHAQDILAEASALTDLATMRRMTGNYPAAIADLNAALELSCQRYDKLAEANARCQLGNAQYHIGDFPAATGNLTQALEQYESLDDRLGQANTLTDLGAVQALTGDYVSATASLSRAVRTYEILGDRHGQASALVYLGTVQRFTSDYVSAIASQTKALELHREIGSQFGQASALNDLGAVQRIMGDYERATASQVQALELFRSVGHRLGEASALDDLGVLHSLTGDYIAAIKYITQALDLFGDLRHQYGQANALNDLGAVQGLMNDFTSAKESFDKALEIYATLGHRQGMAEVLNNRGDVELSIPELEHADMHYTQALDIANEIKVPAEQARALEGIGRCQLARGETDQATTSLRRALEIYEQIKSPDSRRVAEVLHDALSPPATASESP
jgi:tetratricopeptide (TPR) repeat protein/transcriptional regulator with XRE-family HTH domain